MAVVRSAQILGAAVTLLTANGGGTAAGLRVYAPRDWPTNLQDYPAILVWVPDEDKETCVGRGNAPEYFATPTLRFDLRASEGALANDAAAGAALHLLDLMQAQVEQIIINNPAIWALEVQQFTSIKSRSMYDASTGRQLGQRILDITIEYHAEPESFWQPTGAPLTDMRSIIAQPGTSISIEVDSPVTGG